MVEPIWLIPFLGLGLFDQLRQKSGIGCLIGYEVHVQSFSSFKTGLKTHDLLSALIHAIYWRLRFNLVDIVRI